RLECRWVKPLINLLCPASSNMIVACEVRAIVIDSIHIAIHVRSHIDRRSTADGDDGIGLPIVQQRVGDHTQASHFRRLIGTGEREYLLRQPIAWPLIEPGVKGGSKIEPSVVIVTGNQVKAFGERIVCIK